MGIFLIAIGTGGIKPCVVALGADQFKLPQQVKALATYFAMFYASINIGSMVSTIAVPFLRRVPCFGEETCFSLAFALPAGLMFAALVLFWAGSWSYDVHIPEENIVSTFFKCSWHAFWSTKKGKEQQHWLDKANDRFAQKTIDEIKAVYRVGVLFLFYPMFWALYDQQGTRWTIQAMKMNGDTFGWTILPDQMTVANPILIILLIPLFNQIIYPAMGKVGILRTPLQRIVTGCFLCGAAFVISGILELQLRKGYPVLPEPGQSKLILHNSLDTSCTFTLNNLESPETYDVEVAALNSAFVILPVAGYQLTSPSCLPGISENLEITEGGTNLLIAQIGDGRKIYVSDYDDKIDKNIDDPMPSLRIMSALGTSCDLNTTVTIRGPVNADPEDQTAHVVTLLGSTGGHFQDFEAKKLEAIGEYHYEVTGCFEQESRNLPDRLEQGANYNLAIVGDPAGLRFVWYRVTEPNSIHIFWLLPQYLVISVCEVLFSITSLEFAYSQAPTTMKAVLQSLYLMTTALGNLITVLIVEIFLAIGWEQHLEFFTFAGLMFLFSFALMAVAYRSRFLTNANLVLLF